VADELRSRGHRVSFAVQRVDALSGEQAKGAEVWPAPVTPRLLVNTNRPRTGAPNGLGDILGRLGFNDSVIVEALVRAWRQLLETIRPDLVISDFGPFLLLAARGRWPTIAKGTGFSTPPSVMTAFPALTNDSPALAEAETVAAVNRALAAVDIDPIDGLPKVFEASREMAATYAELDPYAEWRVQPTIAPALASAAPEIAAGSGEEVFVYAPELVPEDAPLWDGLERAQLPVRVHVPKVPASYHDMLRRRGFIAEAEPVPFASIGERSRLVVSHGGHGFVCSAMLAGLPQVVCHYDLEKLIHAHAVARLGVGGFVPLHGIDPEAFAASLAQLYRDDALAGRARAAAPGFHSRHRQSMQQSVADAAEALL
jgi:hypothetical protein